MSLPAAAVLVKEKMSPFEVLNFGILLTQGPLTSDPSTILQMGEGVSSFSLMLGPEALAAGIVIRDGTVDGHLYPAPTITDNVIEFWLSVDPAQRASTLFNDPGVQVPVIVDVWTTAEPPRRRRRTSLVLLVNQ